MSSIESLTKSPDQNKEAAEGVVCQCGCGRHLNSLGRGTPRKYATAACRTRDYRRRRDPCIASRSVHPSARSILAQDGFPRWMHTLSSFVKRLLRGKVTSPRPARSGR